jgi:hypothetical protein
LTYRDVMLVTRHEELNDTNMLIRGLQETDVPVKVIENADNETVLVQGEEDCVLALQLGMICFLKLYLSINFIWILL